MAANGDHPPVAEIVGKLRDDWYDDVHGEQLRTVEYGDGMKRTQVEVWEIPPYRSRSDVGSTEIVREFEDELPSKHDPSGGDMETEGDSLVRNEEGMTKYDGENNVYQVFEFDSDEGKTGSMIKPSILNSLEQFRGTYDGRATVASRDTHVVSFRPKKDSGEYHRRLNAVRVWADDEYWFPIKYEVEYRRDGGILLESTRFEEIEFDSGIEAAVFEFEPPTDAKEIENVSS
jgi:outer membrane lipoprotein-sorting protein